MTKVQSMQWVCKYFKINKYKTESDYSKGIIDSTEYHKGNLITSNGLKALWRCITGLATNQVTGGTGGWFDFSQSNLFVGVGDNGGSSATIPASVNDVKLNATTNVAYSNIDQTHGIVYLDTEDLAGPQISIQATFMGANANFSWNEWGVFNGDPSNKGDRTLPVSTSSVPGIDYNIIMLNHKCESMGTKPLGAVWVCDMLFQLRNAGN